ncbi:MAG: hypothetical protein FGM33_08400, partial [Candidatus Kapabacteria bacterium]|nr:hypothetical protein [Candidatus Kapabacteria bacterium]
MARSGLGRSLIRVPSDVFHKSGDPQDLRLGDVIVHASEIPDGCERAIVLIGVPQDIGVERN